MGMQVVHDDRLGVIAGHAGGLPGYGSNMRWLPGRGAGAVALANCTYAPMRLLTRRMLEVLDDHHLVPPAPAPPVGAALRRVSEAVLALVNDWDDAVADQLFADNVARDESYRRRARAAQEVVGTHGALVLERIDAALATDATVVGRAADGREVHVWLALAPLAQPLVQDYSIEVMA